MEECCGKLACLECDVSYCSIHHRIERQWKPLKFWQYEMTLSSPGSPRAIRQRERRGFLPLLEALAMLLSVNMSVSEAAEVLG